MLLSPGTILGRYRIHSPLGAGGMGEVYRATDLQLHRDVAIKILSERLSNNSDALKRFQREARILAALSHPNVLPIHDFGIEKGIPFAVMDLLKGETLRTILTKKGKLSWQKTTEIAVAIVEGLSAAHDKGIIHRDLKPENIFITKEDRVVILDFGLARLDSHTSEEASSVPTKSLETKDGTVLGTVPYMSPEQLQGLAVDSRTDIFSFGCVLYEMLTGRRAFARNSSGETMAAILKEDPPPLSDSSQNIPAKLLTVMNCCLEKDRGKRIHSSHDLLLMLREPSTGPAIRRENWVRPRFSRSKLAWLVLTLLIFIAAGYWWIHQAANPVAAGKIKSLAVLPLKNLSGNREQEYFADGMTEAVIAHLANIHSLKVISRTSIMQYKDVSKPIRTIGEELNVDALIEGSVLRAGDRVRITAELIDARADQNLWAKSYEKDIQNVLALQSEIAEDIAKQIRIEITSEERGRLASRRAMSEEAYEYFLKGRYFWNKRSSQGMKKAVQYFQKALDLDPTYAPTYVGLADCYIVQSGKLLGLPGKVAYSRAKAAITKALEIDKDLAEAHTSLGSILGEYEHDWERAEKEYVRAIELKPNYATAHQWYSDFLTITGRPEEALAQAKRALEIDPLSLVINSSVGVRLYVLGRYDEAIQQFRKTLELDPNFNGAHYFLGRTYLEKGIHEEALEMFRQAKATAYVGYTYGISGREEEARKILKQLTEQSQHQYVNPYDFVVLHLGLKEKEKAFQWLEKAYEDNVEEILYLKSEPLVDPLRSDPRFENFLRRLNLS